MKHSVSNAEMFTIYVSKYSFLTKHSIDVYHKLIRIFFNSPFINFYTYAKQHLSSCNMKWVNYFSSTCIFTVFLNFLQINIQLTTTYFSYFNKYACLCFVMLKCRCYFFNAHNNPRLDLRQIKKYLKLTC